MTGDISPKPTVVKVIMAQYIAAGMEENVLLQLKKDFNLTEDQIKSITERVEDEITKSE